MASSLLFFTLEQINKAKHAKKDTMQNKLALIKKLIKLGLAKNKQAGSA